MIEYTAESSDGLVERTLNCSRKLLQFREDFRAYFFNIFEPRLLHNSTKDYVHKNHLLISTMFASKAIRSRLLSAQRWSLSSRRTETSNIQNTFTKLAIIGGGQMCEAILGALKVIRLINIDEFSFAEVVYAFYVVYAMSLKVKGVQRMSDVTVCDIHSTRLSYLKDKFGVNTSTDLNEAIKDSAVTILSVKPQNVQSLAATLKQPPPGLLLSICAGKYL